MESRSAIEWNAYKWCYDFIKSMPTAENTKEMVDLVNQYRRGFSSYILEKCGIEKFSSDVLYVLFSTIQGRIRDDVKFNIEIHGDWEFGCIEDMFQYNFRNFQREWKRYGEHHYMTTCTHWTFISLLEGARNKLASNTKQGGLAHYETYFGMKIIEYLLLNEYNSFAIEDEERRRRLREEEKTLRELKREKELAEKDAAKAQAAIEKSEAALVKAKTAQQIKRLKAQIEELKMALQRAEERRERAISMAQQTRCGYVYIISNIGSFGEGIYKIGMTRRIEPMQRVNELGDASVPFPFDVHAMIYSEDAPGLESYLHKVFENKKVNAVNWRKEYFRVALDEIREEVERFGVQCQWVEQPNAQQYRDSEWMRSVGSLDKDEMKRLIEMHPQEFATRNRPLEYNPFDILEDD